MKDKPRLAVSFAITMLFGLCVGFYFGWKCHEEEIVAPDAIVPPAINEPLPPSQKPIPPQIVASPPAIENLPEPDEPGLPQVEVLLFQPDTFHLIDQTSLPRDSL